MKLRKLFYNKFLIITDYSTTRVNVLGLDWNKIGDATPI